MHCSNCEMSLPIGARFCLNCGQPVVKLNSKEDIPLIDLAAAAPPPLVEKVHAASNLSGERRLVTALYIDVVGSTLLTKQVGAARWSKIINNMCERLCAIIYRYEGTIARFVGDEFLVFFGAPVAHEDDPVRAVRAGLDILDDARRYGLEFRQEFGVDFEIRVCLSTGPVTIGPVSGSLHYDYSALGDKINLVAQLEGTKRPMAVLVSEETYRLVAPFFNSDNLGKISVKGAAEFVHVYQINGIITDLERVRGVTGLDSPMVGRDNELELLLQLSETVAAGLGRAVLIVGESGLGKTRLIAEWKTAVSQISPQKELRWAEGHCLSYDQGLAYYLLRDLLRSLIGVSKTAAEPETRAALNKITQDLFGEAAIDVYPYLGHMLSITLDEEAIERIQPLDPPALQAQYQLAFKRLLTALTMHEPLVLILEELQWADPTSIEILVQLIPLALTSPMLVCLVTRPHLNSPGWKLVTIGREIMGGRFTELSLRVLSDEDSQRLVSKLTQIDTLPKQVWHVILKKAEGNPFFVEEVLRMMIDDGVLQFQDGKWSASTEIKNIGIPDNLNGLLLARMDRLSEDAKYTLRVASVIGRHFPVRILEEIISQNGRGAMLVHPLGKLESTGLIEVFQVKPELVYRFCHSLLQDAAYNSVLAADRQHLHHHVGKAMESLYANQLDQYAPQLAHHFYIAGIKKSALRYLSLAGDIALNSYANHEAESYYRQALELTLTEAEKADLLFKLGQTLYWQSRFQDAIQVWGGGIELYQSLGNDDGAALLFARSARACWDAGDTPGGLKLCQQGLTAVDRATAGPGMAHLLHEASRAYFFNGYLEKARPLCEDALALAERLSDITVQAEALTTLGLMSARQPETALATLCKAAELAESTNLLSQAARAQINLAALRATTLPDFQAAKSHYQRAAEFQRLRGSTAGELLGLGGMVGVLLEAGEFVEAEETLPVMRRLLSELTNPGPAAFHIYINEALLLRYRGNLAEAAQLLQTLQTEERKRGNMQNLVDIDCHFAELILASHTSFHQSNIGELSEAETILAEAIDVYDQWSKAGIWPRAILGMVYTYQGRLAEAHNILVETKRRNDTPLMLADEGWLLLAEARLLAVEESWPEVLLAYRKTASLFERLGKRWWRACVLQEWAEAHVARREATDLEQARALLQEASSLFAELGVYYYATLVEETLQKLEVESYAQALAHQQVSQEMVAAGKIQAGLLPTNPPQISGWQLAAGLEPSRQTSGDFYDFIPLPDGRLGIVIADVADKGAAAALFMALSSSLIRTYAVKHDCHPELVLEETNRRILADTHTELFVTVFYAVLDPASGTLWYSNAGHNPPFHVKQDGEYVVPLRRTGIPVGILMDTTWEMEKTMLAPGDVLVLYTDGVTDAQNIQESFFSEGQLLETVKSNLGISAQEMQEAIFASVHQFCAGAPQFDDITLMILVRESAERHHL